MEPPLDLPRIAAETLVARVEYRDETQSTNDLALELIGDSRCNLPLLIVTAQQTQGRGRGANIWWSAEGALTFSLVIDTQGLASSRGGLSPLSLLAALAACRAIDGQSPGIGARLKWPNDILLGYRKVCGILVEAPARPRDRLVIGVGINVNNSQADAPRDVRRRVVSLADATGRQLDLTDVLVGYLRELQSLLDEFRENNLKLRQACAPWCALTSRNVTVKLGSRRVSGICLGIDDDGALLVSGDGQQRCLSGIIEHVDWGD